MKRSMIIKNFLANCILLFLFFMADIGVISQTGAPLLCAVYCYALATFLYQKKFPFFYLACLCLGLESFIAFDLFGLTYCYSMLLFLFLPTASYYLASKKITALIWLILYLLLQTAFLYFFKLIPVAYEPYTLYLIGGNLSVLYISLKWFFTVEQGNRL